MSKLIHSVLSVLPYLLLIGCGEAAVSDPVITDDVVSFNAPQGTVTITALAGDSWRVQCIPDGIGLPKLENLIYTEKTGNREKVSVDTRQGSFLITSASGGSQVRIRKRNGQISFVSADGKVILEEAPDTRSVTIGKTGDLNSLAVSQSFITPKDEFLFGTGQFQDCYLNIRGLTRRLTQVNTQISIPMIGIRYPVEQLRTD